ncbi:MAG TPA: hypothetical protein P5572_06405 [Phycisphaerae bacterium]|nr:hypothetical protein [Phycisphaerae bacterium]
MRKGARTLLIAILVVVGALIAGGAALWYRVGESGTSDLEQWLGRQVVGIIEAHITPRVAFESVDYQAPKTVVVTGLDVSTNGTSLITVKRLLLELAEIPSKGEPIQIQRIELDEPVLQFRAKASGGFSGWSNFVQPGDKPAPAGQRLSDVLVLRHVAITDGAIVYANASTSGSAMRLPGVNVTLKTQPTPDEAGWYALAGSLERAPLLKVDVDARINLDTAELDLAKLAMDVTLAEDKYDVLPPQLQELLRAHDVQGEFALSVKGRVPLKSPQEATGEVHAELRQARAMYAGVTVPLDDLTADVRLPQNTVDLGLRGVSVEYAGRTMLALDALQLAATGIPGLDDSTRIARVELDQPQVLLARDPQGGWIGWNELLETTSNGVQQKSTSPLALDAFALDEFDLRDGVLLYDSAEGDEPLRLDAINVKVQMPPMAYQPGWNTLKATVTQEPLLDASAAGRVNLHDAIIDLESLQLDVRLSEDEYAKLPERLRKNLNERELHGALEVRGSGRVELNALERSDARLRVLLTDGGLIWDEKNWPIDRLSIDATLGGGQGDADFDAALLGGDLRGHLRAYPKIPYEFDLSWEVNNLDMERTLRVMKDETPKYAGHLSTQGKLAARFWDFPNTLNGDGDLRIDHGRLMNLPILRQLIKLVAKTKLPVEWPRNDTAQATFELYPDRVQITQADVVTALVAARGGGAIYFDKRLDLRVNAGVLERLQERLGKLGDLLGSLSDKLVTYTITGDLAKPQIGVSALGLGG